jgi:hypothetical protein
MLTYSGYRSITGALQELYRSPTGALPTGALRFTGALQELYRSSTRTLREPYRSFAGALQELYWSPSGALQEPYRKEGVRTQYRTQQNANRTQPLAAQCLHKPVGPSRDPLGPEGATWVVREGGREEGKGGRGGGKEGGREEAGGRDGAGRGGGREQRGWRGGKRRALSI